LHNCTKQYAIPEKELLLIKLKMLNWATRFSIFAYLDSNNYPSEYKGYECLLGVTNVSSVHAGDLTALQQIIDSHQWAFGHIAYDYKNIIEPGLSSSNSRKNGFPDISFFVPEIVCVIHRDSNSLQITAANPDAVYADITAAEIRTESVAAVTFTAGVEKAAYLSIIDQLRQHIARGDCYEINYCTKGYAMAVDVDPVSAFMRLNKLSPAPFAACYKLEHRYMMCASPERFIKKQGQMLLSQPIKGTAKRGATPEADLQQKELLAASLKEQAENVMIVDLVRNDLARSCITGTIKVDELFGIYTFPQVHQMISTVSGELRPGVTLTDALRNAFPMGSMTGAPKYRVMQLIDHYEHSARELFSGTIGYIDPAGNCDFNVVIRSLFYNTHTRYLSYHTGGAITYDSIPEQEWEEMRLKAWALERIFQPYTP